MSGPTSSETVRAVAAGRPAEMAEDIPARLPGFLTRQPLLDSDYRVVGYELGVRERVPLPVPAGAVSWRQIQDELLLAGVMDLDYRQALGRRLTLLDLEPDTLQHPWLGKLPRDGVVLAMKPIPATPELLARGQALARSGFALALDESGLTSGLIPLARQCRYLRVDVGDNDLMALCDRLVRVQGIRGPRLIARNVQTEEAFAACRKLSFDLYQGYFFARPGTRPGPGLDPGRLRVMRLLNLVMNRAEYPAIEAEIKLDPAIAHRLLRFVNSPAVGLRYPVRAINHMLLLLGHDTLYRWLTLLLFSRRGEGTRDQALLKQALVRARLMELLAESCVPAGHREGAFVAGILSMLEALLCLPMAEAVADLRLDQDIVDVLLHRRGPLAPCLRLAMACEGSMGSEDSEVRGVTPETVNQAHLQALVWSEGMDL